MKKRNETIARVALTIYLLLVFFMFYTQDFADGYVEYNNGQDLSLEKFFLLIPVFVIAVSVNLIITRLWNNYISNKAQSHNSPILKLPKTLQYLLRSSFNLSVIFISLFFKDLVFKIQPILYAPMFIIFNLSLMVKVGYDYPKYKHDDLLFEEYQSLMNHLSNRGKLEDFEFKSSLLSSFNYNNPYQEEYLFYALLQILLKNNTDEFNDLIDRACMTDKSKEINEHLIIELQNLKGLVSEDIDKEEYANQNSYFSQKNPVELSLLIEFYSSQDKDEYLRNYIIRRNTKGWDHLNTSLRVYMEQYERTDL